MVVVSERAGSYPGTEVGNNCTSTARMVSCPGERRGGEYASTQRPGGTGAELRHNTQRACRCGYRLFPHLRHAPGPIDLAPAILHAPVPGHGAVLAVLRCRRNVSRVIVLLCAMVVEVVIGIPQGPDLSIDAVLGTVFIFVDHDGSGRRGRLCPVSRVLRRALLQSLADHQSGGLRSRAPPWSRRPSCASPSSFSPGWRGSWDTGVTRYGARTRRLCGSTRR